MEDEFLNIASMVLLSRQKFWGEYARKVVIEVLL